MSECAPRSSAPTRPSGDRDRTSRQRRCHPAARYGLPDFRCTDALPPTTRSLAGSAPKRYRPGRIRGTVARRPTWSAVSRAESHPPRSSPRRASVRLACPPPGSTRSAARYRDRDAAPRMYSAASPRRRVAGQSAVLLRKPDPRQTRSLPASRKRSLKQPEKRRQR
jgi:hypothetical protein